MKFSAYKWCAPFYPIVSYLHNSVPLSLYALSSSFLIHMSTTASTCNTFMACCPALISLPSSNCMPYRASLPPPRVRPPRPLPPAQLHASGLANSSVRTSLRAGIIAVYAGYQFMVLRMLMPRYSSPLSFPMLNSWCGSVR